jgi:hypothetical protein
MMPTTKTLSRDVVIPVTVSTADLSALRSQFDSLTPDAERLLASGTLSVPADELLAYALYYEWVDSPPYNTYAGLLTKVPDRIAEFEDYLIRESDGSLRLKRPPTRSFTEKMGIAASLAFSSRLLDLPHSDFAKIPESPGPRGYRTMDWESTVIAADAARVFQVESKGTHDGVSAGAQERDITAKKLAIRKRTVGKTPLLLVGTVFDLRHEGPNATRLTVHDPPEATTNIDPAVHRVVTRLRYYFEEWRRINRGWITLALANRLAALESADEAALRVLTGVPLVDTLGRRLRLSEQFSAVLQLVGGQRAFGRVYDLRLTSESFRNDRLDAIRSRDQRLYFRGLLESTLLTVIDQDFPALARLDAPHGSLGIQDRDRRGLVRVLRSGLVVGTFNDSNWDRDVLPKLLGVSNDEERE